MTRFQHAWQEWAESTEGKTCREAAVRIPADLLEHRLFAAYTSGFIAGDQERVARRRRAKKSISRRPARRAANR